MKISRTILGVLLSLMILGCSDSELNEYEQLYSNTADSLKLYKNLVETQLDTSVMIQDIAKLSFDDFKRKYNVEDKTVGIFAQSVLSTIEIAKAFQSIEENIKDIESLNLDHERLSDVDTVNGDYSFNKVKELSLDQDKIESGSDSEFEYVIYE